MVNIAQWIVRLPIVSHDAHIGTVDNSVSQKNPEEQEKSPKFERANS